MTTGRKEFLCHYSSYAFGVSADSGPGYLSLPAKSDSDAGDKKESTLQTRVGAPEELVKAAKKRG